MNDTASKSLLRPARIRVDASSICQLRCPSCPTGRGELNSSHVGGGFLSPRDFEALLETLPEVESVELSNWGEVFLNKQLADLLRIAFERNVEVTLGNGVNLSTASEKNLRAVVEYRVGRISVSIDGASQATYEQYRVGGNFERVLEHIRRINSLKRELQSDLPRLSWQFVVFGHNEHELPLAKRMAGELGMEFKPKLSWDEEFSPIRDRELVRRETGLESVSRREYFDMVQMNYMRRACTQLWSRPQVNFDGKVLGCCVNTWADFGNAFDEGLLPVLNGPKMTRARQMLMGKSKADPDVPCTTCSKWQEMQRSGRWIDEEEIAASAAVHSLG